MARSLLLRGSLVLVGIGLLLAACLEHVSDRACPVKGQTMINGICYDRVPDGFVAPDGFDGPQDLAGADLRPGPDLIVACTASKSCPDDRPICSSMDCRACTSAGDDPECAAHDSTRPRCDPPSGKCVECRMTSDCTGLANPVCDTATHTCRPCATNAECPTLVCKSNQQCATANEVAIVNNAAGCTPAASPYCEITQAITANKPYIAVVGSATPYAGITLPPAPGVADYTVSIIGPGRDVAVKARIFQSGNTAVTVANNTGHNTTISIDGMEISGSPTSPAVDARPSVGTTSLTITHSFIDGSGAGKIGINVSGLTLVLDSDAITGNVGGGLTVADGTAFTITNTMIYSNGIGSGKPGVIFSGGLLPGTFRFNTIANNGDKGNQTTNGGIQCGGLSGPPNPAIEASIIWGNSVSGGSSTNGPCTYNFIDHDDSTTATNSFSTDPLFVGGGNFHVQATSPVKDKVTAAGLSGTLPTHDYDGDTRPRATTSGYDVGADQVVP